MNKTVIVNFVYFITAFVLILGLTPLVRMLAFRLNALDRGGRGRKMHVGTIPRLGGVAIFIAFLLPLAISLTRGEWDEFHKNIIRLLVASFAVFLIGVWDDIKGATIISRLAVEFAAAYYLYAAGVRITVISNPFGVAFQLHWLSLPITLLWIVVITNAFNLIDGLDGLATGTGIMIALAMVLLNLGNPEMHMFITIFALLGALSGFLIYNFPPASIFMGDSGSLFLGFFLASYSIQAGFKASAAAAISVPFIAFAVPLLDMIYAILRRWNRGLPLGTADREHIHHKLLEKGIGSRNVVLIFYAVYAGILGISLFFIQSSKNYSLAVMFLIGAVSIAGLRLLGYLRFREFFKENYRHFHITRRRRYFCYLIKRFQRAVSLKLDWANFCYQLDKLFADYELAHVEIRLPIGNSQKRIYEFCSKEKPENVIKLEFPLRSEMCNCGEVIIHKNYEDQYFLCISELTLALSTAFGQLIKSNANIENLDWNLKR